MWERVCHQNGFVEAVMMAHTLTPLDGIAVVPASAPDHPAASS
jgi:hypothetical protein